MFAQTKENWIGLPTVQYVEIKGKTVDTSEPFTERVTP